MKKVFLLIFYLFTLLINAEQTPSEKFKNVKENNFYSKILKENRKIFIYVPEEKTKGKKYPVLYMLDGEALDQYEEALGSIINYPEIGKHIVIGIKTVKNRDRDLIPGKTKFKKKQNGADRFLEFLTEELVPYIDKFHQTSGNNILYGTSNGGLFTIYALLKKPETFTGYIANCPFIGGNPGFMNKTLDQIRLTEKYKNKYLYIYYGLKDRYRQVVDYIPNYYGSIINKFKNILIIEKKTIINAGHDPRGAIENGLKFIYKRKTRRY